MDSGPRDQSPDRLQLTVDGAVFDVAYDPSQPGAYHYTRRTGPAVGYGFTHRNFDHSKNTTDEHIEAIRRFLRMVNPVTGYIEDVQDNDEHGQQE
ncbi:MAG: hypothetical protein ABWY23_10610 [Mycetocola sp.]